MVIVISLTLNSISISLILVTFKEPSLSMFLLQLLEKEPQNMDEDLDFRALEDGFVS